MYKNKHVNKHFVTLKIYIMFDYFASCHMILTSQSISYMRFSYMSFFKKHMPDKLESFFEMRSHSEN